MHADHAAALKPAHIPDEEWKLRVQLADFYHLVDYMGWTEMIFNHISGAPAGAGEPLSWSEPVRAELRRGDAGEPGWKVDLEGRLVEPSPYPANPAGFALHSAIHGAREDACASCTPIRRRCRRSR